MYILYACKCKYVNTFFFTFFISVSDTILYRIWYDLNKWWYVNFFYLIEALPKSLQQPSRFLQEQVSDFMLRMTKLRLSTRPALIWTCFSRLLLSPLLPLPLLISQLTNITTFYLVIVRTIPEFPTTSIYFDILFKFNISTTVIILSGSVRVRLSYIYRNNWVINLQSWVEPWCRACLHYTIGRSHFVIKNNSEAPRTRVINFGL